MLYLNQIIRANNFNVIALNNKKIECLKRQDNITIYKEKNIY